MPKPFFRISKPSRYSSLLLAALLVGLVAAGAVYWTFTSVYDPVPVVVAARDLEAGKQIGSADVKVSHVSRRDAHPKALKDLKEVVGTYTRVPLTEGEVVLSGKIIRNPEQMIGIYGILGENDTIITLKSSQVSWPKVLRGGDLVSVVAVYPEGVREVTKRARVVNMNEVTPIIGELKNVAQGQAANSSELLLALSREEAKKVLGAVVSAKAVYLLPEHPGTGEVNQNATERKSG
ncbi:SAF domain-containing protein [Moorellaceae bacterium AZ2]